MKKNLFYYLFTVICSVTLFASCSDDDEKVVNPVPQTTFTGENGLQLTYTLNPQLHSRSATYKRNGLLIRKTAIKSSRPFQCAYYPLTP